MPSTIHLHRVLRAPPERVWRAFSDPIALVRWIPPYGFLGVVHHLDFQVGGTNRMSFINFSGGGSHSFGAKYLEIVPHERLVYTDDFDDPKLAGTMVQTITFTKVSCGTELRVEQAGIPDLIPPEMCYLGWQESLAQLAHLVEPEIPAGA
jgi:uncharacterized protein YndB with AHSA1/START domain